MERDILRNIARYLGPYHEVRLRRIAHAGHVLQPGSGRRVLFSGASALELCVEEFGASGAGARGPRPEAVATLR